jgi:hypothetical protein
VPFNLQNEARDLVIRARSGDQLAMATIAEVSRSAREGSVKAKAASDAIATYIDRNPPGQKPIPQLEVGAEAASALSSLSRVTKRAKEAIGSGRADYSSQGFEPTCLMLVALPMVGGRSALRAGSAILSNGPPITPSRIGAIGNCLKDPALQDVFLRGAYDVEDRIKPDDLDRGLKAFVAAGKVLCFARVVQLVCCPTTPISTLSPLVAWELGQN